MSRIIVSHPTGNANVRAALEAFQANSSLEAFCTGVGIGCDNRNVILGKLLARRRFPIPSEKLHQVFPRELVRLVMQRLGLPLGFQHETGSLCIDRIYRGVDSATARFMQRAAQPPSAVYCYEDGALATFRAAKTVGAARIYDLPIGYWKAARQIQCEEAALKPEWKGTMPALKDSDVKLERKDAELRLADAVIVASRFTAKTLEKAPFPIPRPQVIPYGCPTPVPQEDLRPVRRKEGHPLRVLYVGSLSQRKGLSYLLDAVTEAGRSVELTLIGKRVANCAPIDAAIQSYRWIESAPHDAILKAMREHDVLAFPSLFEGFGLVITEALSQGIPVITTPHTCGPDVIRDGVDGFIVPIRDADAIAEKFNILYENHDTTEMMKRNAWETACKLTWGRYRTMLTSIVIATMEGSDG